MKNTPYLILSFSLGLQDYTLRVFRFEFTDNGEFSVVPFASENNIATLLALGFRSFDYTHWVAAIQPEELKASISQTHYVTGPNSEQNELLLKAAIELQTAHSAQHPAA